MEILTTILYIAACVLLFSLTIAIHEFGHFIVALKLGLRVEVFSLGFGPALWKKKVKGVEYRISAIPLGGYVSIPDVDPEGTKKLQGSDESAACARIPAWKEILVSVAGPLMNVVLAVVLAVVLSLVPGVKFGETPAVIDVVLEGGAAEAAGIPPGDRVVSVAGRPVSTWTEMMTEIQLTGGKPSDFVIERGGEELTLSVTPKQEPVTRAYVILAAGTNATGAAAWMPNRNPLKQLAWDAGGIFRILKGLVTPRETKAVANAVGGPVMIAQGIYDSMRNDAWDGIGFLRFLNVNLAVLNLLPIPVLDGGLILFALIALIFRRRVPEKVVGSLSMVFMCLLMLMMATLIVKDSMRSWRIHNWKAQNAAKTTQVETNANESTDASAQDL